MYMYVQEFSWCWTIVSFRHFGVKLYLINDYSNYTIELIKSDTYLRFNNYNSFILELFKTDTYLHFNNYNSYIIELFKTDTNLNFNNWQVRNDASTSFNASRNENVKTEPFFNNPQDSREANLPGSLSVQYKCLRQQNNYGNSIRTCSQHVN